MIFTVLEQMYKCGCERGVADLKSEGILDKINDLAEWDLCRFPSKEIERRQITFPIYLDETGTVSNDTKVETKPIYEENRKFLGETPKLAPGNCILVDGQVIAIDGPDRLVLVVSKTGGRALTRIYDEIITPEYELYNSKNASLKFTWDSPGVEIPEDFDGEYRVPYSKYKYWKEFFVKGRDLTPDPNGNLAILVNIDYIFPVELYFTSWTVKFKKVDFEEGEESLVEYLVDSVLRDFCVGYTRLVNPLGKFPTPYEQVQKLLEFDKQVQINQFKLMNGAKN